MSIAAKRRYAAAAFIALLTLSVFWPSPIVSVNRLCCNASIGIDELSFLGRESPAWDVVFWFLAGVVAIAIVQSGEFNDLSAPWQMVRRLRWTIRRSHILVFVIITAAVVAIVWLVLDSPVTAWAEAVQSDELESVIRILNRLGGGMNPVMLIVFFLLAGVVYRHEQWVRYGVAMILAGISAGLLVQIVKLLVGRSRPELWLGPFHHARMSASSFPSGHTVGAFALCGVLMLASPSRTLRVIAFVIAASIGFSRILAFRHWTSDVIASAAIGFFSAWIARQLVARAEMQNR